MGFVASEAGRTSPYLPFMDVPDGAPFRWRLGVRPLDLDDWIELGPGADEAIAAKEALNREHRDTVFAALADRPDVDAAAHEVAEALLGHLRRRWPDRYRPIELDATLHPLDAAARLVPEDLVLMVADPAHDGRLVFAAGSVCFPNRWDLRSKIGLPLTDVHAPVARLNDQLATPIERFFDRLTPERSYWRLGWGMLDTPDWYTPLDGTSAPRPPDPPPTAHHLRVERETLRRFPRTGSVLFTIRTYVVPIPDVGRDRVVARRLASALEALPDDVRTYKGVVAAAAGVVELLRSSAPTIDVDNV